MTHHNKDIKEDNEFSRNGALSGNQSQSNQQNDQQGRNPESAMNSGMEDDTLGRSGSGSGVDFTPSGDLENELGQDS